MSNTSLLGAYAGQGGDGLMFRNVLINGNFDIWQRGITGAGGYVADRWYTVNTSAFAQSTDVPNSVSKYSASLTSSVAFPLLAQRIEGANIRHLAEKQVTISFWAKCTGTHNLFVELGVPVTTEDTFGSYPNGATTGFSTSFLSASPSSSWTFYSTTVTLPSTVTRGMQIIIGRGNVVAASTTLISQVQLEAGAVATPFERRPIGTEIQLCQRYFEKSYNIDVAPGTSTSIGASIAVVGDSGSLNRLMPNTSCFAVPKRINATVSAYSETGTKDRVSVYSNSGSTLTVSSIPTAGNTRFGFIATTTNAVDRQMYYFHWTAEAEL